MSGQRDLVVLGSTGSIGTQALEVVRRQPGRFRVVALAAGGGEPALLAQQALEFDVQVVAVAKGTSAQDVQLAMYAETQRRGFRSGEFDLPRLVVGPDAASAVAGLQCDIVLNAITGSVGLLPTLAALDAGRTLALANKESLIVGGALVTDRAKPGQLLPVDSEHSALAQCLRGGRREEVRRLLLTASGGPFRGRDRTSLAAVTPAEALAHPTWAMGPVVTVNSATLMNKGLEVIEAHLLFDVPFDAIHVVVHPQSYVHSMVEFTDGSTLAQASPPDMALPIALALSWPDRLPDVAPAMDWTVAASWEFEPLDEEAFPAVRLATRAGRLAGTAPAVLNAANEECVTAFLAGRLAFPAILDTVSAVLAEHDVGSEPATLTVADVLSAESWARSRARQISDARADEETTQP